MVIIRKKLPTEYEEEDIGDLDFKMELPPAEGLKCATCGDKIEKQQKAFLGTKQGYKGVFFFHEVCVNQETLFPPKQGGE